MCVCVLFSLFNVMFYLGPFVSLVIPFAPVLRHCACVPPRSPHTQAVNGPEQFPRDIVHVRRVVYKRTGFCTRDSIKMKQTIILEFICRANCQSRFGATRPRPPLFHWPAVRSRPINCCLDCIYLPCLDAVALFSFFLLFLPPSLIHCHPRRNGLF